MGSILNLLRILGALFALAGPIAAGVGVYWWDHRPAGQPAWARIHVLWFHWSPPDSLAAQLATSRSAEVAATGRMHVLEARQGQVTVTIAAQDQAAQTRIVTLTRTLKQEVPIYVDRQAVAACVVPVGFVRLWNAAASGFEPGAVPVPAGAADDAASGVGLDTVSSVAITDLGAARANAQQLSDLQDWVRRQQALNAK